MNGIERIKSRIENDTQAEIDAILNNARNEAEHICLQFKSQAEAVKSELTSKNAAEAKALEERLITSARTDAKKSFFPLSRSCWTRLTPPLLTSCAA